MSWRLAFKPSAAKTFAKLAPSVQARGRSALDLLVVELNEHQRPVRSDPAKLKGRPGEFRLKIPDWRVILRLERDRLVVLVVDLGSRGDIY